MRNFFGRRDQLSLASRMNLLWPPALYAFSTNSTQRRTIFHEPTIRPGEYSKSSSSVWTAAETLSENSFRPVLLVRGFPVVCGREEDVVSVPFAPYPPEFGELEQAEAGREGAEGEVGFVGAEAGREGAEGGLGAGGDGGGTFLFLRLDQHVVGSRQEVCLRICSPLYQNQKIHRHPTAKRSRP